MRKVTYTSSTFRSDVFLKLDPKGNWSVVVEYDGWPNGMKLRDGDFLVADHKLGLVQITPSGSLTVLLGALGGRPLHGLNDLTVAPDGSVYTTDQGQTGMHDPRGRVIKCGLDGGSTVLIDNGPSPNGVVFDSQRGWLYVAMTRSNAIWRVPLMGAGVGRVGIAVQLSGGIGPDGLALDSAGRLLAVQAPLWIWRFDSHCRPIGLWEADEGALITNLAVRREGDCDVMYVTDSIRGRILRAVLEE